MNTICVILVSGLSSGMISYLMHFYASAWSPYRFLKSVLFGLFFSAIVLFVVEVVPMRLVADKQLANLSFIVYCAFCFLFSVFLSIAYHQLQSRLSQSKKEQGF